MVRRWLRRWLLIEPRPCYLYRLYSRTGGLLYVGISVDPKRRVKEHSRQQPWATKIHHYRATRYDSVEAAARAEVRAIRRERPKHNVLHNRRKSGWRSVLG